MRSFGSPSTPWSSSFLIDEWTTGRQAKEGKRGQEKRKQGKGTQGRRNKLVTNEKRSFPVRQRQAWR